MKIYIEQIPDSGLELSETCQPENLDLNKADIRFSEPINLSVRATKGDNIVSINLKIDSTMHLNCSRCLEEFIYPLSRNIDLNLLIEDKKEIDITDNLREEIILSYPLKPLCQADCLGLCATCGQNLNKGRCNHGTSKKTSFKISTR
ncbi:MAG: DUF177 domain-containing protein [Omnitrophica bacterium]|nr:DUF177 domain-containing protein [Candidatus Omnitrophota bacterium]